MNDRNDKTQAVRAQRPDRVELIVSRDLKRWLVAITVLLSLAVVGLWTQPADRVSSAFGRTEPERSPSRDERWSAMVTELQGVNANLQQIQALLTSGRVKVTVDQPDARK